MNAIDTALIEIRNLVERGNSEGTDDLGCCRKILNLWRRIIHVYSRRISATIQSTSYAKVIFAWLIVYISTPVLAFERSEGRISESVAAFGRQGRSCSHNDNAWEGQRG